MTVLADFELPPALEASEPPEARGIPRDAVRMLVSRRRTGEITHHPFTDLPNLLLPGDLVVVNTSATLPAAVRAGLMTTSMSSVSSVRAPLTAASDISCKASDGV